MRDRLLLPIVIPVGVAAVIALLIFSVGKILLELDPKYSTAVAICGALLILVVSTAVSALPHVQARQLALAGGIPVAIVLGVGLYIAVQPGPPSQAAASGAAAGGGPAASTALIESMVDNKFADTAYTVPANTPITITATNDGQAIHNWHVLGVKDASGKDIATQLLPAGQKETLTFTIATPGTYNFQCDVHPTEMKGTLTVVEAPGGGAATGGAAAASGGGSAGGTTIIATDNKFDKTSLTIKAGTPATVTMENKGAAIHNWHVLNVKSKDGKDITTGLLPGGQSDTITFEIDTPGTYNFQCDVHPVEMKGTLTVQ